MNILATNLMGLGVGGAALANALGVDIALAKTATGSAQGDAYAITTALTQFTTTAASTGAKLPDATPGQVCIVANNGANALSVYPFSGDKINNGSTDAAFSVAAGKTALFVCVSTAAWFSILSA